MGKRNDEGFLLLTERDEPFEREGWVSQIKEDGRRVQVEKRGDSIIMRGRDNIVEDRYPEVLEAFRKIPHDFKVDTEFAVFEGEWKTNRGLLQTRDRTKDPFKIKLLQKVAPVSPAIFDLLELDGNDMRNQIYEKRKKTLESIFSNVPGVRVVKDYDRASEAWSLAQKHELEGIVERDKAAIYVEGRSDRAVKIKRKKIFKLRFTGYEVSNAGITLTNEDGFRVACHGHQHTAVKADIDGFGYCNVMVRAMADKTEAGKLREIVFFKKAR